MKQFWKYAPGLFLLVYLFAFFSVPVNLIVTDLGRHITNGVQILNGNWEVLYTNFYSYTQPNHAFINHHWATGVVFHLIHSVVGFAGLHFFYILLILIATGFFIGALPQSQRKIGIATAIFLMPLLAYRTEIRPEGFSYLFMALVFFILKKMQANQWTLKRVLLLLIPIQILWVNFHIFWIIGPGISGVFLLKAFIDGKKEQVKPLLVLLGLLIAVSLINPFGLQGLLAPFNIFNEYGYMVAENQSLPFMLDRTGDSKLMYFILTALLALAGSIFLIFKDGWKKHLIEILLSLGFLFLSITVVRGISLFAFMSIPLFAITLNRIISRKVQDNNNGFSNVIVAFSMLFVLVGFFTRNSFLSPLQTYQTQEKGKTITKNRNGIGLVKNIHESAKFFTKAQLPGPIFNNYDIGSYLIYALPQHHVFVDNRPEAYSVALFKEIYQPMQEDPKVWSSMSTRYGIQSIFFNRHDNTPWGQAFLIRIVKDPNWVPVYVDAMTLILLKNTADNATLIGKYRLPDNMFSSKPN